MRRVIAVVAGFSALWLAACAEQEVETDSMVENPPVGTHSGTTNLQDDAIDTAPGSGSAVGGDPAGAGTQPLRDEGQEN